MLHPIFLFVALFLSVFGLDELSCGQPRLNHECKTQTVPSFKPYIYKYISMDPIISSPFFIDDGKFYSNDHESLFRNA